MVCCFAITNTTHADLPLTVDDILADKNRFKLDTDISYYNHHKTFASTQGFETVDLGNGRSIVMPVLGDSHTNTDSLIAGVGLRYGVGDKFEMGVKGTGLYRNQRFQNGSTLADTHNSDLQDISLSTQYQLTNNHKSLPNSLLFGELSVYDKTAGFKPKHGASALIGGTVYTINDPIVLSLTGTYQYQGGRELTGGGRVALGDTAMLNGSVGFAVNPDITLTGGVGVRHKWADKTDNKLENNSTQTTLNLGLAYALSARSNLTANVRTPISGSGGSTLSVGLSTKLGQLPPPLSQKYRQTQ
ncbi:transporter [Moraxella nasovis]|uniref:transporter n=1 Tax=Moraxella nasovis TaxID=2904121 RepID=UPI001F60FBEA|nr:transporter [Moraxella nasovis]UNU73336.1 transporter [Moraxella nasovis]